MFVYERILGTRHSVHRRIAAFVTAFLVSSIVRIACLCPCLPLFGTHLANLLAPIERDDWQWLYASIPRLVQTLISMTAWWDAGRAVDGPFLGAFIALISNTPTYILSQILFDVPGNTTTLVVLVDMISIGAGVGVIGLLSPHKTGGYGLRHALEDVFDLSSLFSFLLAIILASGSSALASFVLDKLFLFDYIRHNAIMASIPTLESFFITGKPQQPFALYATISSNLQPLTIQEQFLYILPFATLIVIFQTIILPRYSATAVAVIVAILTTVTTFVTFYKILPVTLPVSASLALSMGLGGVFITFISNYVMYDVLANIIIAFTGNKPQNIASAPVSPVSTKQQSSSSTSSTSLTPSSSSASKPRSRGSTARRSNSKQAPEADTQPQTQTPTTSGTPTPYKEYAPVSSSPLRTTTSSTSNTPKKPRSGTANSTGPRPSTRGGRRKQQSNQ